MTAHSDFTGEPLATAAAAPQCKDCQRFFPGVQLIPLPHGNVCLECSELRQDNGLSRDLFDLGVQMSRAQRDEILAQ